jgi:hypothetical protein
MKKLFLTLSLILNFTFAEAATTSCDSQDTACIAQLLSDTSDANDRAVLGMVVVGAGAFYFWNNRSEDKKEELIQSIKDGNGLPLINSNRYDLSIFPAKKDLNLEIYETFHKQDRLNIDKALDVNIIRFRYKFN